MVLLQRCIVDIFKILSGESAFDELSGYNLIKYDYPVPELFKIVF